MLHRTTWIALPVVSLVMIGAGLGWWGYSQNRQSQALAGRLENQYATAFHTLTSDLASMSHEADLAELTGDQNTFQQRIRQLWHLSFEARSELSRLPETSSSEQHVRRLLAETGDMAANWLDTNTNASAPVVQRQLGATKREYAALAGEFSTVQSDALRNGGLHLASGQTRTKPSTFAASMTNLDAVASKYVAVEPTPQSTSPSPAASREGNVTSRQAVSDLGQFMNVVKREQWKVQTMAHPSVVPMYAITGESTTGHVFGMVTKSGGHVVSFHLDVHGTAGGNQDFASVEDSTVKWLQERGFSQVRVLDARQSDGTAYFTMAPEMKGVVVPSQAIRLAADLGSGRVVSFDASKYYQHPVGTVLSRVYSTAQLQKRLGKSVQIKMHEDALILDKNGNYQPATVFYGLKDGHTYRATMNARTGAEMEATRLN